MNKRIKKKKGIVIKEELYNLDSTFAEYIYPRIKAYRKMKRTGYPCLDGLTEDGWEEVLLKIENAFKLIVESNSTLYDDDEIKVNEGLEVFSKYFLYLWD